MSTQAIAIFTKKSVSTIQNDGGTQAWVLDPARARRCDYVVLCRNTRAKSAPPKDEVPELHGSAFLVGRISNVVPSTMPSRPEAKCEDRWKIMFDQYAEVRIPDLWGGWRNPVRYTTLEELGIDIERLDFKPMPIPQSAAINPAVSGSTQPLTIERAKQELAITFGVNPEAIEITIRG